MLDREGLLPAITFIFSRAGCDAAVKQCLRSSLRLTTDEERARIAEVVDRRCADLAEADLIVLDYHEWREGLLRGLAAHHAGMLPVFRHTVEELFTAGLGQGRIRHGDTGFGHQHARPHGGAGAAGQVQRRAAHAADAGGVHAADRAGRPARHRRRGPRGRAVASRRRPRRGRRAGLHPDLPAAQFVCAVVQHDHQPGAPDGARRRRTSCWSSSFAQYQADRSVVGLVRGVERGERMLDEIAAELGGRETRPILDYVRLRARSPNASGRSRGRHGCSDAGRPTTRWPRCAAATSSPSPTAGAADWPSCWNRPRQRRSAAAGAHRTPLGGPDFVGRLLGGVGTAGVDVAAQAGRAPQSAGAARPRVGAAVGSGGPRRAVGEGQAQRPARGARRRPRIGRAA